jgi:hypothetical protein
MLAAMAIVAAATAIHLLMAPWLASTQLIPFFAAVLLTTFLCGGAAGSFAVALSSVEVPRGPVCRPAATSGAPA